MIQVGTTLHETYRIDKLLGEGGMGAVYLASHVRLPKKFAIKVLHTDVLKNPEAYARFRREAEITSSIGHPNIVEVLDFNTTPDGQPYIVMEMLEGEDMSHVMTRDGKFSLERTLALTRSISSALAAAHAIGVVHRDLKPQNIFISSKGHHEIVKIVDFGISKIAGSTDSQTKTTDVIGTPAYMSPEQAKGRHNEIDGRADLFSLSTMVYEMLSGHRAFVHDGDNSVTILYRILSEDPTPLANVPQGVTDVVKMGMAKLPENRFPDVASFQVALENAATGRPFVLGPNPSGVSVSVPVAGSTSLSMGAAELTHPPGGRKAGGSKVPLILGAVVLLAGAGVGAKFLLFKGEPATVSGQGAVTKPPPVVPEKVTVTLAFSPTTARATLEGKPVMGNTVELVRGSPAPRLRVEADGYDPAEKIVPTERDTSIEVRLVAKAPATVTAPTTTTTTTTTDKGSHGSHSSSSPKKKKPKDDLEDPFK